MNNVGFIRQIFSGDDGSWSLKRLLIIPLMICLIALHFPFVAIFWKHGDIIYINAVMPYVVPLAGADITFMSAIFGINAFLTTKLPLTNQPAQK